MRKVRAEEISLLDPLERVAVTDDDGRVFAIVGAGSASLMPPPDAQEIADLEEALRSALPEY